MIRWSIAIGIALLIAWLAYARAATPGQRGRVLLLALLRFAAVLLVAALFVGAPAAPPSPASPLVALDVSASWRRAGGDDSTLVRALRTQWRDAIPPAATGDILLIGDSLRDIERDAIAAQLPADMTTRVRAAVDRASALGRPLVLLTDGEIEDPDALADAPPGSRVRVFPKAAKADAAIADLTVPTSATAGDTLQIAALVGAGAAGSPEGTLRLSLDGAAVGSVAVPALAAFATTRVTLPVPLPRGARVSMLQAVIAVAGDVEPRNDTLRAVIEVGDRPPAVFISTAPDLDVREVLVVLRGALALPTRAYLRLAPGAWRVEGTLEPIREEEVRARAAAAGLLIVHGDTSWAPQRAAGAVRASRALWTPAPPTAAARPGELTRAAEWYISGAPVSPLSAPLAGLPWDSLPPLTLAGVPRGSINVLEARLGKRGDAVPAIAARDDAGMRTLVISGSGYAGWSLRGGRSAEVFGALWGTIFDWLAVGRGDVRAARPLEAWQRAGDAVRWRRGGSDSVVTAVIAPRGVSGDAARQGATTGDTVRIRFASGAVDAMSSPLSAGVYDVRTAGGSSVLVVNAAREWLPKAPTVADGELSRGSLSTEAPRLSDEWWPFAAALLLLCAEWIARRFAGLR